MVLTFANACVTMPNKSEVKMETKMSVFDGAALGATCTGAAGLFACIGGFGDVSITENIVHVGGAMATAGAAFSTGITLWFEDKKHFLKNMGRNALITAGCAVLAGGGAGMGATVRDIKNGNLFKQTEIVAEQPTSQEWLAPAVDPVSGKLNISPVYVNGIINDKDCRCICE